MPQVDYTMVTVQWGAVICASLAAAISDLRTHRIPNRLTLPILVAGLAWSAWVRGYWGIPGSVAGCLLLAFPFVLLWLYGGGGAGDAKMMGALGAWLGFREGIIVLLAVLVVGAISGMGVAMLKGQFRPVLGRIWDTAALCVMATRHGSVSRSGGVVSRQGQVLVIPYGFSIFTGVCLAAAGIFLWRH